MKWKARHRIPVGKDLREHLVKLFHLRGEGTEARKGCEWLFRNHTAEQGGNPGWVPFLQPATASLERMLVTEMWIVKWHAAHPPVLPIHFTLKMPLHPCCPPHPHSLRSCLTVSPRLTAIPPLLPLWFIHSPPVKLLLKSLDLVTPPTCSNFVSESPLPIGFLAWVTRFENRSMWVQKWCYFYKPLFFFQTVALTLVCGLRSKVYSLLTPFFTYQVEMVELASRNCWDLII